MIKESLLSLAVLSLVACGSNQKKPQINHSIVDRLQVMECEDLLVYRKGVEENYKSALSTRKGENTVNVAVGVLGALTGAGAFNSRPASRGEQELHLNLSTATSIAKQKGCEIPDKAKVES